MTDLSADRIVYLDDYVDLASLDTLYSPQLSGDSQGNAVFRRLARGEAQH